MLSQSPPALLASETVGGGPKPQQAPEPKPKKPFWPKKATDIQWYHIGLAGIGFMAFYQTLIFSLWIVLPVSTHEWINRYSWSQGDAAAIFAIIMTMWFWHKNQKDKDMQMAKWFMERVSKAIKTEVEDSKLPDAEMEKNIQAFIHTILTERNVFDDLKPTATFLKEIGYDLQSITPMVKGFIEFCHDNEMSNADVKALTLNVVAMLPAIREAYGERLDKIAKLPKEQQVEAIKELGLQSHFNKPKAVPRETAIQRLRRTGGRIDARQGDRQQ